MSRLLRLLSLSGKRERHKDSQDGRGAIRAFRNEQKRDWLPKLIRRPSNRQQPQSPPSCTPRPFSLPLEYRLDVIIDSVSGAQIISVVMVGPAKNTEECSLLDAQKGDAPDLHRSWRTRPPLQYFLDLPHLTRIIRSRRRQHNDKPRSNQRRLPVTSSSVASGSDE